MSLLSVKWFNKVADDLLLTYEFKNHHLHFFEARRCKLGVYKLNVYMYCMFYVLYAIHLSV